jgi:hypothetical protein
MRASALARLGVWRPAGMGLMEAGEGGGGDGLWMPAALEWISLRLYMG